MSWKLGEKNNIIEPKHTINERTSREGNETFKESVFENADYWHDEIYI